MDGRTSLTIELDDLAFTLLQEQAARNRRSPADEAALQLEQNIYWERYGQFERPSDPEQPRPEPVQLSSKRAAR